MKGLLYQEEHTSCCNYSKLGNGLSDNGQAIFECSLAEGETSELLPKDTELLFLISGTMELSGNFIENLEMTKGDVILLVVGHNYTLKAKDKSRVMVCKLPLGIDLCDTYSMSQLYEVKSNSTDDKQRSLKMNDKLWNFAEGILACIGDGLKCTKYLRLKITEMMFLFRAYYTKEELAGFFCPILNKDMEFANMIMVNWDKVKNKSELAKMTNLSPSRFGVKFKEVFGVSPYQWLMTQRSEHIYYDLIYTNSTLKEISEKYMFGSVQHFNDFCKKQFGTTPGKVREQKRAEQSVSFVFDH